MKIKRIWSYAYLERREGSPRAISEWAFAYAKTLTDSTGVIWRSEIIGSTMRVVFNPILAWDKVVQIGGYEQLVKDHIEVLAKGRFMGTVGFGELWQITPELDLPTLIGTCKNLALLQQAHLHVNRQGYVTMINLPRS